jgi:hypothetical protein
MLGTELLETVDLAAAVLLEVRWAGFWGIWGNLMGVLLEVGVKHVHISLELLEVAPGVSREIFCFFFFWGGGGGRGMPGHCGGLG